MLEAEEHPPSEISLLLTDDEEIKRLNIQFRAIDSTTDVLSFPSRNAEPFIGDIAISIPEAERQALHHRTPLIVEICCLAVHGGLHLLGFDHKTAKEEALMLAKMNNAVRAAGLSPVESWASLPH